MLEILGRRRSKIAFAIWTALVFIGPAWGQLLPSRWDAEVQTLPVYQVKEGDFEVALRIEPVFRYHVYTLMGEPVEISQMAWCIPNSQAVCTWRPKYWKSLGSSVIQELVPPEVLAKIRIISVKVVGHLREKSGAWMTPGSSSGKGLFLAFDPGSLDRPYMGSADSFLKLLTPEQRVEYYYSFNTPGSPNWKDFINISSTTTTDWHSGALDESARYVTPEAARTIVKRGFVLDRIQVVKISYDFWAVKEWITKNRFRELASERQKYETFVREATAAEEKARATKNLGAEIQARESKISAKAELEKRIAEERSLNAEVVFIEEEHQRASIRLADERRRVESRRIREAGLPTTSASILFLIDVSGSMSGARLASAKEASLKSSRDAIKQGAEISVLAFSGECGTPIAARLEFTRDEERICTFIEKLAASGGTPLSSALKEANEYMDRESRAEPAGRMIILLADGDDRCGGLDAVLAEIGRKTVVVRHETIGLEVGNGSAADQLRRVAQATGGKYHYAASSSELVQRFEAAMDAISLLKMIGTFGSSPGTSTSGSSGTSSGSMQSILDTFD